jgi:hypothetical protein
MIRGLKIGTISQNLRVGMSVLLDQSAASFQMLEKQVTLRLRVCAYLRVMMYGAMSTKETDKNLMRKSMSHSESSQRTSMTKLGNGASPKKRSSLGWT